MVMMLMMVVNAYDGDDAVCVISWGSSRLACSYGEKLT
jgi:hypothetical protein